MSVCSQLYATLVNKVFYPEKSPQSTEVGHPTAAPLYQGLACQSILLRQVPSLCINFRRCRIYDLTLLPVDSSWDPQNVFDGQKPIRSIPETGLHGERRSTLDYSFSSISSLPSLALPARFPASKRAMTCKLEEDSLSSASCQRI